MAQGLDITSLDGRARMSKLALPYLRQLPEGVYRQLMFQALAERTGLELSSLMQLEARPHRRSPDYAAGQAAADYDGPPDTRRPARPPRQRSRTAPAAGYSNLAQAAIALLLHQPDIARLADADLLEDWTART